MPSQTVLYAPKPLPLPRRRLSVLTSSTLGQDVYHTLSTKSKFPSSFDNPHGSINDYAPPAPPPPSPVNFPTESWSTCLRR